MTHTKKKRMRRFALVWFTVVIGIFSASKTQLPAYIQSTAGAAAMLFAIHLYTRGPARTALERALLLTVGLVWACLPVYVLSQGSVEGGKVGTTLFPQPTATLLMWICAAAGLMFIGSIASRRERLVPQTMAAWAILFGCLIVNVMPVAVRSIYQPTKDLGRKLAALPKEQNIAVYGGEFPESLVYYSRRKIEFIDKKASDGNELATEAFTKGYLILADEDGLKLLARLGDIETIRTEGKLTLVQKRRP